MNWENVYQIIVDEHARYKRAGTIEGLLNGSPTFGNPKDMRKHVIKEEKERRFEIDKAVEEFSSYRNWPQLSPSDELLVLARLIQAKDLLEFLRVGGLDKEYASSHGGAIKPSDMLPPMSDGDAIKYLLIYYWHRIGCDRYLARSGILNL